ncbi:GDSL-type esterase/lipase family protein [Streptomyces gamaensis]|uniref:GDSL-type esterase/lipase family protein n=1 Tax=Streptomyces gamaensis TaxID=1763542 RepID=A0ABW0YRU6_9ACTN
MPTLASALMMSLAATGAAVADAPAAHTVGPATADEQNWKVPRLAVMPLGDSITHGVGSSSQDGYRADLRAQLASHADDLKFVGSIRTNDWYHEGHSSWQIDDLSERVEQWLVAAKPNVVLLNIGTNDIGRNNEVETAPRRLGHLVDQITAASPDTVVLVSSLVPNADAQGQKRVEKYNAEVPRVVEERRAKGLRVDYVDMGAVTVQDLSDELHPNDAGYVKMTNSFYQGIMRAAVKGWIRENVTVQPAPIQYRPSGVYASGVRTSEVFQTRGDGQIYYSSYTTGGSDWSPWELVAPGVAISAPTAVYHADKNVVEVFAIRDDRQVYHAYHTAGTKEWSSWQRVASGVAAGQLQAVYHADKKTTEVFAVGVDEQIYHSFYTTGGSGWSGWYVVAPGEAISMSVTYDADRATTSVYALGTDRKVYQAAYTSGSAGWTRWRPLPSGTGSAVVSVNHADKKVTEVFALGAGKRIYHSWSSDGGASWAPWTLVADGEFTALNAVYHADRRTTEVFALSEARQIHHSFYTTGGPGWSDWTPVAAGEFTIVPSSFYHADKKTTEVLGVGVDRQVYHSFYTTGKGSWSSWAKLGS